MRPSVVTVSVAPYTNKTLAADIVGVCLSAFFCGVRRCDIFCGSMVGLVGLVLVVEFVRRCVHFLWSDGWVSSGVCAAVCTFFVVRWILVDVG